MVPNSDKQSSSSYINLCNLVRELEDIDELVQLLEYANALAYAAQKFPVELYSE
jgi:hypothetical protein